MSKTFNYAKVTWEHVDGSLTHHFLTPKAIVNYFCTGQLGDKMINEPNMDILKLTIFDNNRDNIEISFINNVAQWSWFELNPIDFIKTILNK